jgi:hypothetical protein
MLGANGSTETRAPLRSTVAIGAATAQVLAEARSPNKNARIDKLPNRRMLALAQMLAPAQWAAD